MKNFKSGDIIRNINPYFGEHAYIVQVDNEMYGYLCGTTPGKHSQHDVFNTHEINYTESEYYKNVGLITVLYLYFFWGLINSFKKLIKKE